MMHVPIDRVAKLQANAKLLLQRAHERGLDTGPAGDTPVIPIMVIVMATAERLVPGMGGSSD